MFQVQPFYHDATNTISYVVYDRDGGHCAIIDSVLDFAANSGKVWTEFADLQLEFINSKGLTVDWILETHAHADHLSSASYLKVKTNGKIGVGQGITNVQLTFKKVFNISDQELTADGDVFDHLFNDGDEIRIGELIGKVMATPGHTNDSVTYLLGDNAFVGDTLFMPDSGTARCDFPGGDARTLFESVSSIHALPEDTKLWMCHDYQPNGRELKYSTSVKDSRENNIHINQGTVIDDYVMTRETRDKTLDVPKLLYPSIQSNIRAGKMPMAEDNKAVYFKTPLQLGELAKIFVV